MSELLFPLFIFCLAVFSAAFRIANQYGRGVVFRLGKPQSVRGPGLYWIIPPVERRANVDLRAFERVLRQRICDGSQVVIGG